MEPLAAAEASEAEADAIIAEALEEAQGKIGQELEEDEGEKEEKSSAPAPAEADTPPAPPPVIVAPDSEDVIAEA